MVLHSVPIFESNGASDSYALRDLAVVLSHAATYGDGSPRNLLWIEVASNPSVIGKSTARGLH